MFRRRGRDWDVAWVYGAARRAAADDHGARDAAKAALATGAERPACMVAAVRKALAEAPCTPLDALPLAEREAIGLAQILSLDVDAIAAEIGCDRADVKARMRAGLARLAPRVADMPVV